MKRFSVLVVILIAFAAVAVAQDFPPLTGAGESPIGPRDRLLIRVFEDPSFGMEGLVGEDGRISLPVAGKVDVSGLTPLQAEARIKGILEAKYLRTATVSIQVVEYGNQPISVIGAVTKPGTIRAAGNISLIQAITQAGGLAQGYGKQLYVLRTGQRGLTEQIAIDIEDLMVSGNPDLNLPLAPNDVVNVPMDTPIMIYVGGEVMKPGRVEFRRSQVPTLLQAIIGAGGTTDRASKKAVLKRIVNGKEVTRTIDLRRIMSGSKDDEVLQDNDTVYIKESLF